MNTPQTYEELLEQLIAEDERIMVLTAENRAAIRNLPPKIGDSFVDFGIAEMTMIGAAAGMALRGRIPITHALATFITLRAYEFARTDVGIPGLPVKLVGGVPGFLSEANGPTHQAIEDIGIMRSIPPMNIFAPADNQDMLIGLQQVIQSDSPFYIRFNAAAPQYEHQEEFAIGKAEVIGDGTDAAIVTYGFMFNEVMKAKAALEAKDISVRVLNLRTVKPIDEEAVLRAAKECSCIVTVEDHFLTGGLYSILSELFMRHRIAPLLEPMALDNRWFKPALLADVLEYEGFTAKHIAERVTNVLSRTAAETQTAENIVVS